VIKAAWYAFVTWIGKILSAIGRIILEALSIKVLIAIIVSYVYLQNDRLGTIGFVVVAVLWMTVIGFRYAEKVMKLVHRTADEAKPKQADESKLNP
jgi:chromosome condensin MukBEF MukE localization factor